MHHDIRIRIEALSGLNHEDWRSFCYESEWIPKNLDASNFIDQNLI